jgi:acyl-CoA reductase-like NAD-dependent aldehyde dehydrogenase
MDDLTRSQTPIAHTLYPGPQYPLPAGSWPSDDDDPKSSLVLVNPATEDVYARVSVSDHDGIERVVAAARAAYVDGPWRRMPAGERAQILVRISDAILAHADELATLQSLETGLVRSQSRGMHVHRTAENFRFFAEILSGLSGESYEQTGQYLSIVTREPVGVAVLISPWNAPLILASMKMAAALALGNCVIVKPSEYAPLATLRLGEIANSAGLPAGVLQVVCGTGAETGHALVAHPGVDVIGFIGGTETGKRIMATAAGTLKKVGLELGGKSANIVLASANFDNAVDGSLLGIYAGNGEQCLAGSRILVEDSIADRFIEAFVARTAALKVGDPFAADSEIGPLAFKAHYDRVLGFADQVADHPGYHLLTGGGRAAGFDRGYYFQPTVVEAASNELPLCQDEIFGPFAVIQRVHNLDDALRRANQSDFGLVSYIWSDDLPSVMRARRELRAGTVWVNTAMARDLRAPFGGFKQSGIGRDGLPGSIELFTEEKTTMIPQEPVALPKLGLGPARSGA